MYCASDISISISTTSCKSALLLCKYGVINFHKCDIPFFCNIASASVSSKLSKLTTITMHDKRKLLLIMASKILNNLQWNFLWLFFFLSLTWWCSDVVSNSVLKSIHSCKCVLAYHANLKLAREWKKIWIAIFISVSIVATTLVIHKCMQVGNVFNRINGNFFFSSIIPVCSIFYFYSPSIRICFYGCRFAYDEIRQLFF